MAEAPVRVALLARPGGACEQLQAALRQAGAEVVLVADPLGSDAGSVAAASPGAVLVALEPAVEDVLERYDPVLLDPAMTVIYDEAHLAATRDGWDAARWTRHLAAKLAGHDDVLPPGAGVDTRPGTEAPQAAPPDAAMPEAAMPEAAMPEAGAPPPESPAPAAEEAVFEFDAAFEPATTVSPGVEVGGIVPDGELSLDALDFDPIVAPAGAAVAEPAAAPTAQAERPSFDFSALSLEEIPGEQPAVAAPAAPALDAAAEPGAVVVLAGIGGPDAVRQFLSGLPDGFARPVLVRQRLDGGRHDRLVRQMQRATSLPVELAEAGGRLVPGHVYILPDGLATGTGEDGTRFVAAADPVPVLAGLPAAGSAIVLLSGSDAGAVAEVLSAAAEGALAAAQSPAECFDSVAPAALIAAGGTGGAASDLAAQVAARWPA